MGCVRHGVEIHQSHKVKSMNGLGAKLKKVCRSVFRGTTESRCCGRPNQSPSTSTSSQTLVSLHIHCHCVTGQSFCFLHKMSLPSLQERPVGCRNGGGSWSQYQTGRRFAATRFFFWRCTRGRECARRISIHWVGQNIDMG